MKKLSTTKRFSLIFLVASGFTAGTFNLSAGFIGSSVSGIGYSYTVADEGNDGTVFWERWNPYDITPGSNEVKEEAMLVDFWERIFSDTLPDVDFAKDNNGEVDFDVVSGSGTWDTSPTTVNAWLVKQASTHLVAFAVKDPTASGVWFSYANGSGGLDYRTGDDKWSHLSFLTIDSSTVPPVIPEPGALIMAITGLFATFLLARRRS